MKIIVDGYGGDNAPLETVKGCRLAADEYGVGIILTGKESGITEAARRSGISLEGISIINADDIITMEDSPRSIAKEKSGSSMAVGLKALSDGMGDAFVSAGNTGALVIGSTHTVGRIKGIKRVALAPIMPSDTGCFMLIDGGANAVCTPEMLRQFALMGSAYMDRIMHIPHPRVGLVNIGSEESKGAELQREAYKLIQSTACNFTGNLEARDIPRGVCDVVVADGFTGNVVLKLTEGCGMVIMNNLKGIMTQNLKSKIAGMLVKGGLKQLKKKLDYTEYGGAPLMGTAKPVIKAHGSSNANAFKNAIRQAVGFIDEEVIKEIARTLPEQQLSGE